MNYKILTFCAVLAITIWSCKYGEAFKTFTYSNDWEINYPPYLKKSNYVYPGSEFQARNRYRGAYMFLREENSELPSTALIDTLSEKLITTLVDSRIETDSVYTMGEATFHTQYIVGLYQDRRMFYLLSLIEHNGKQFHYLGGFFNDKRELWQSDYEKSLHSWKPLK